MSVRQVSIKQYRFRDEGRRQHVRQRLYEGEMTWQAYIDGLIDADMAAINKPAKVERQQPINVSSDIDALSSKGRTSGFEPDDAGSTPAGATISEIVHDGVEEMLLAEVGQDTGPTDEVGHIRFSDDYDTPVREPDPEYNASRPMPDIPGVKTGAVHFSTVPLLKDLPPSQSGFVNPQGRDLSKAGQTGGNRKPGSGKGKG